MPVQPRRLVLVHVVAALAISTLVRRHAATASDGHVRLDTSGDTVSIDDDQRAAGLTWDPAVAPADRAWIEQAIATARPEAQRLIAEVDGLVTIHSAPLGAMIMGATKPGPDGFDIYF